jgi:hypothetical protein
MDRATAAIRTLTLVLLPLLGACASRAAEGPGQVQPPAPVPVETNPPQIILQPSEAELRAADRAELDGRELGLMWTFEDPPLAYWAEAYEFEPTPEWLERVRLASVRYGEYCSGSFVSPNGLVMTNHHCARECIEANSAGETDYVEVGFTATSRARERECPGLYLDQLVETTDVTERVHGAAPPGATPQEIADARARAAAAIEEACAEPPTEEQDSTATAPERHCQVVALYHGARYHLYEYRRFAPVKLVFAPELQAGFFGGDPDNFTYPRYTLDVSFVRAYQPGGERPADTREHYFRWDAEGAAEDELVFITGNPGTTSRLITVAQLLYEQEYRHPFLIQLLEGQRDLLQRIASQGEQAEQSVRQQLFEIENSLKAYRGQYAGLLDTLLVGTKIRWERELRERVAAVPALQTGFGDVWDRMADIQRRKMALSPRLNVANTQLVGAPHLSHASQLAQYVRETALPEAQRSEQFRANATQVENALRTPTAVDPQISHSLLALHLDIARRWLTPRDPLLRGLFADAAETAEAAADRLIRSSRVLDVDFRDRIMRGGPDSLAASDDPLLVFARDAAILYDSLEAQWSALIADEAVQKERLATAALEALDGEFPPDATFTLRIADGVVARFPFNGTLAPAVTNYYGMYGRAAAFGNEMPWTVPAAFERNRARIDLATPLNFVSTNDLTGGNSGSPMIDREGRIVGLAFDSNIDFLPGVFVYDTMTGRAISVHSAGIIEALRDAYGARALVTELTAR